MDEAFLRPDVFEWLNSPRGNESPMPMWLDCDTGHDDAYAILFAGRCPRINLLGISTVHGNSSVENCTYNSLAILKAIGRQDVPVYPGAKRGFARSEIYAPNIHGLSGLDGTTCLPTPDVTPSKGHTIQAMYSALIEQPPKTAYLVATGALTNVALLFASYPELVDHVKGLSIMGGAIGGRFTNTTKGTQNEYFGNTTPWAEFNIYCDPESADAVFSIPELAAKTTLIPLDTTHQVRATKRVQSLILHGKEEAAHKDAVPHPLRMLFHEIIMFFAHTYETVFNFTDGPPLHDPLAVLAAVAPAAFDDRNGEKLHVHVHRGDGRDRVGQCGRTIAVRVVDGAEGIRIPRRVDIEGFWKTIDTLLSAAEPHSGV